MLRHLGGIVMLACTFVGLPWALALPSQAKAARPLAMPINVNNATVNDLQKLPGIGPGLAKQIVAYREKNGPFRRVEDLMLIKGMGFKKWKAIRPYIRVGDR